MSLRVDSSANLYTSQTCDLNTDLAAADSAATLPDSSPAVCTANAPDVGATNTELDSLLGQVQLRKNTIDSLKTQAKAAGLSQEEADAIGNALDKYQGPDFNRETGLVRSALNSDNPARAARTYLDLAPKRFANPDRISPDVARALVMGVGQSATNTPEGHKGVIGRAQANQAADALTNMMPGDYLAIRSALGKAGQTDWSGASPDTERALILKAVAARKTQFPQTTPQNLATYGTNASPSAMAVTDFANKIHGQHRAFIVSNTEVLGLDNPNQALEQRWNDSCAPTAVEMNEADADPVYAYGINSTEQAHSTKGGLVSTDQALTLAVNGGIPKPRGTQGAGVWPDRALNTMVSSMTDRTYSRQNLANTPAARTAALNQMEKLLDQGVDVPIVVSWTTGGAHAQLCSDVQGTAPNRQFLINDPWNGQTGWLSETSIINGNTNFFAGNGTLSHIYTSTPNP